MSWETRAQLAAGVRMEPHRNVKAGESAGIALPAIKPWQYLERDSRYQERPAECEYLFETGDLCDLPEGDPIHSSLVWTRGSHEYEKGGRS